MSRGSWEDIEALEPIQQWCAYYLWDREQWIDVLELKVNASASLGDKDGANKHLTELMSLKFPYVAAQRANFEESGTETLRKLRGLKIKFRAAAPIGPVRRHGRGGS